MSHITIQNIIWDMDGVLFPYNAPCINELIRATAQAVTTLHPTMEADMALQIAQKSQNDRNNCFTLFVEEYGLTFDPLVRAAFAAADLNQMIIPNPQQNSAIRRLGSTNQIILTRSDMNWATRLVNHLGLNDIFNKDNIVACDNDPQMDKAKSQKPFLYVLEKTGFDPAKTIMVEDTEKNLIYAKQAGLNTALIGKSENKAKQDFVDYHFPDTITFLKKFS